MSVTRHNKRKHPTRYAPGCCGRYLLYVRVVMKIMKIIFLPLVLSSCGGNNENLNEDKADFYEGIWSGLCQFYSISGEYTYSIKQYEFIHGVFYERMLRYESSDCTGVEVLSFERSGQINEIIEVNVDGYNSFCFSLIDQDDFMPDSYIFYFYSDFLYETTQMAASSNAEISQSEICNARDVGVSFDSYYERSSGDNN